MGQERDRQQVGSDFLPQEEGSNGEEKEPHRFRAIQGHETQETGTYNTIETARPPDEDMLANSSIQARFEVQKASAKLRASSS